MLTNLTTKAIILGLGGIILYLTYKNCTNYMDK